MLASFNYESKDFSIRTIKLDDYHDYYKLYSNSDNMKYLSVGKFENEGVALHMLKNLYYCDKYESYGYVIIKDNKIIGLFDIFEIKENKAQISYILLPEYQKLGIMENVLKIFIKYLKKNTQINEICAKIMECNFRSIKLVEKLGFYKDCEEKMIIKDKLEILSCYKLNL